VLFHRRDPSLEVRRSKKCFYIPAMEDFQLDLIIGEGAGGPRSVKIELRKVYGLSAPPRRAGLLTNPFTRPVRHSGAAEFLH